MNTRRILSLLSVFALVFAMIVPAVRADEPQGPTATIEHSDDDTVITISDDRVDEDEDLQHIEVVRDESILDELDGEGDGDYSVSTEEDEQIIITFEGEEVTWVFEVSYVTANWQAWAVVVSNDDSHTVQVSATVLPVLTMTVDNDAIDFGNLELGEVNEAGSGTQITLTTNATDWASINASFSALADDENYIPFALSGSTGVADWSDFDSSIADGSDKVTVNNIFDDINGPVLNDEYDIYYYADPAENQAAGEYNTTVEYTVTGNF